MESERLQSCLLQSECPGSLCDSAFIQIRLLVNPSNNSQSLTFQCLADLQGEAVLIMTILFMAVTSSGSAEFVAVSSLFTYEYVSTLAKH